MSYVLIVPVLPFQVNQRIQTCLSNFGGQTRIIRRGFTHHPELIVTMDIQDLLLCFTLETKSDALLLFFTSSSTTDFHFRSPPSSNTRNETIPTYRTDHGNTFAFFFVTSNPDLHWSVARQQVHRNQQMRIG